jgi:hypothetical protein
MNLVFDINALRSGFIFPATAQALMKAAVIKRNVASDVKPSSIVDGTDVNNLYHR